MRRSVRPALEMLEGKTLLSGVATATPGLVASLTAVASRTNAGPQVVETFTETNVSDHEITVVDGPSLDGFTVSRGGKTVWNPHQGVSPQILTDHVLEPHQSITLSSTWDGRSNQVNPAHPWVEGSPLSGTFTISNDLDHRSATASVTIPKAWTAPLKSSHVGSIKAAPMVHALTTTDPLS